MINFIKTLPQYLIPQKLLSSVLGKLASQSLGSQAVIRWFVKQYNVDMSEAKHSDLRHYPSFNDFFIRELKESVRTIDADNSAMVSPVDGCVSQLGDTCEGRIIQAKGRDYSVNELLGVLEEEGAKFSHGHFATLYLSPKDYHRIHMPMDGTLTEMTYIPGDLFAVKPSTANSVPNLFARNERLVLRFNTEKGPLALVMVGAMIVGNMATVWEGTLPRTNKMKRWEYSDSNAIKVHYKKGEELGHFKLGSTVVLVTSNDFDHNWHKKLAPCSPIKMGERLNA